MRTKIERVAFSLAIALSLSQPALGDTAVLRPSADATLFEVNPNNSAGGAEFFIAGTTQNRTLNRALLYFDVANALPPGARISYATVHLDVTRRPRDGFDVGLFGLHRLLQSWGEGTTVVTDNPGGLGAPSAPGDATWNERFAGSTRWTTPGGQPGVDFVADFSSSTFIYDVGTYEFEGTPSLIDDIQTWIDTPSANFGWMLKIDQEEINFTARRFASREDPNGGPILTIEYTVVPEPDTVILLALGAVAILFGNVRRWTFKQLRACLPQRLW